MTVRSSIDIEASADSVWPLIAEFRRWPDWGPTVSAVDVEAEHVAPGVSGRVRTPVGVWLPFTITEVVEGRSWGWRVAGIEATGHQLVATGPSTSRVEFTAPTWGAPYVLVLRRGLTRLKHLAETERSAAG